MRLVRYAVGCRRPTFDRAFTLGGEVGSRGYGVGQFTANGALIPDTLAGRLAVRWNGFGGDIPNIAADGKEGDLSIGAARGSPLFTPDDQTEVLLTFNYGSEQTHSPRFMLRDAPGFPVSATDPKTLSKGEQGSGNLRIRHEFDSFVLNIRNTFDLRAYGIVNAKLTWQNGDVTVYGFANNLFDERYEAWGQSFGTVPTVRTGEGRVVGVGTSFTF